MHAQLREIEAEFHAALDRLHQLANSVPPDRWSRRPGPDRWSAVECIAHLNLTTLAFRPLVERALEEARRLSLPAGSRFRRGLFGWLLWRALSSPGRFRVKTQPSFVPVAAAHVEEVVAEFERLQQEQIGWVRAADGLPLGRVKVPSPFDRRVKYNLFACLAILPRHQHRHLWQAEQAMR
ncbi:MAG: DinB family protein [Acidobacteria bacterium]|nr:MAG: DinB family protein [Acidobacteriota bacterium]